MQSGEKKLKRVGEDGNMWTLHHPSF